MSDLIAALQIFLKYGNPHSPTWCEHDTLNVAINPSIVSQEDIEALKILGFHAGKIDFHSFRFGSC